jgi:hypothetical protein
MWLLILVVVLVVAALPFLLRLLPPPIASTLVRIANDRILVRKGAVRPYAKDQTMEILRASGITEGWIAILPGNRVVFSRSIPDVTHQRLRNVLLNQSS